MLLVIAKIIVDELSECERYLLFDGMVEQDLSLCVCSRSFARDIISLHCLDIEPGFNVIRLRNDKRLLRHYIRPILPRKGKRSGWR